MLGARDRAVGGVKAMVSITSRRYEVRLRSKLSDLCLTFGIISFLTFATLFSTTAPVKAQAKCGDRNSIVNILGERYAEKPVATGMTMGGGVIEVFAANDGSWTMIVTMPTGHACFRAAGEGWESFQELAQGAKI